MKNIFTYYKNRIPELDGIRGLAVILVLFFHYGNNQLIFMTDPPAVVNVFTKITSFFWSGVDLFFILSGFLIGTILLKSKASKNYFKTFYIRRFLRIFPLFYLLLLIYLLLKVIDFPDPGNFLFKDELNIGYYFLFIQNYMMAASNTFAAQALTPTWSLAVEEQFYLILPALLYFTPKKWFPFLLICLIGLSPLLRSFTDNWYYEYITFHNRMDTLLFGVLIAYLISEKNLIEIVQKRKTSFFIGLIFILSVGGYMSAINKIGVFNYTFLMFIYGGLLVFALAFKEGILGAILRSKLLRVFGFLSYGIYVFHQLISGMLHSLVFSQRPMIRNLEEFGLTLVALVVTFIFAYIIHFIFELPLVKFGQKNKY